MPANIPEQPLGNAHRFRRWLWDLLTSGARDEETQRRRSGAPMGIFRHAGSHGSAIRMDRIRGFIKGTHVPTQSEPDQLARDFGLRIGNRYPQGEGVYNDFIACAEDYIATKTPAAQSETAEAADSTPDGDHKASAPPKAKGAKTLAELRGKRWVVSGKIVDQDPKTTRFDGVRKTGKPVSVLDLAYAMGCRSIIINALETGSCFREGKENEKGKEKGKGKRLVQPAAYRNYLERALMALKATAEESAAILADFDRKMTLANKEAAAAEEPATPGETPRPASTRYARRRSPGSMTR